MRRRADDGPDVVHRAGRRNEGGSAELTGDRAAGEVGHHAAVTHDAGADQADQGPAVGQRAAAADKVHGIRAPDRAGVQHRGAGAVQIDARAGSRRVDLAAGLVGHDRVRAEQPDRRGGSTAPDQTAVGHRARALGVDRVRARGNRARVQDRPGPAGIDARAVEVGDARIDRTVVRQIQVLQRADCKQTGDAARRTVGQGQVRIGEHGGSGAADRAQIVDEAIGSRDEDPGSVQALNHAAVRDVHGGIRAAHDHRIARRQADVRQRRNRTGTDVHPVRGGDRARQGHDAIDHHCARAAHGIGEDLVVTAREGQGSAVGQRHRTEDRTGRSTGTDLETAGVDGGAAGIGVLGRQDQRAEVGPRQLSGTGQFRSDRGRPAGTRQGAVADADRRGRRRQVDRVALDRIAVGCELHARDADCAGHVIDRDQAARALEDGEAGLRLHGAVEQAVGIGPFRTGRRPDAGAAVDGTVVVLATVSAIPEQQGGRRVNHIDLARNGGLHQDTLRAARRGADGEAVVGQDAAVGHQAIDAEAIGTAACDVERAVQRQVVGDREQRGPTGTAEGRVDDRAGRQVERADGEVTALSARQDAAVGDAQGTVDRARAAQVGTAVDEGVSRERAVNQQGSAVDGRAVREAARAGQGQLTRVVREGLETGDRRKRERRHAGTAEGRSEAVRTGPAVEDAADAAPLIGEHVGACAKVGRGHGPRAGQGQDVDA